MKSVFAIAALGLAAPALAKKVPVSSGPVLTVREGLRQVYSASTTQEYVDAGAVYLGGAKRLPVTLSNDHNEISLAMHVQVRCGAVRRVAALLRCTAAPLIRHDCRHLDDPLAQRLAPKRFGRNQRRLVGPVGIGRSRPPRVA